MQAARSASGGEVDSQKCNISMEEVKELGEMIGVSWVKTGDRAQMGGAGREGIDAGEDASSKEQGMGEVGKKGWVISIIGDERPHVIGLQEMKCGMVDDHWVETLWGGKGFGFSQLPANGNSG
ncbi:hypothetical protein Tco_0951989 [Tanacetum coccineum]|uniref:Uncharacterized protein n=1 Tax=Tanacetum coccineum TaxID=301880 RepID=A0ABQ5E1S8_9ASTR